MVLFDDVKMDNVKELSFIVTLPSGIKKNKCRHCNKLMSVQKKKTTTHLMRHLKEACPMRHNFFPKPLNQAAASGDASNQTQLTGVVLSEGESSVHTFVFSLDRTLQKRVLSFVNVPLPHNGPTLAKEVHRDPKGKGPDSYSSYLKQPISSTVGKRKFDDFMMKLQIQGKVKNDLELYFDDACYPNLANFDALAWWKGNEGKYKVLSRMAKDILSIPITTVVSESTFSAGGRIIDKKKRASMRRDTIEVLLYGRNWIKEMYGIRRLKEENDDPIKLEFESVYEMIDPNASTSTAKVVMPANQPTTSSVPIQLVKTTNKPPKSSKKTPSQFKKSRKT
ncbi:hypothetical protein LIER_08507 [Lithospermum erythrorhizon]|uniref:BED-type domain-containing protein n=1 Tax=Lithospermum erythrorhizon TaxID=34254 RepID=A0AAV3PCC2_LITER